MSLENPQLDDGYTKIANPIMDALARTQFSGYERRVLDFIFRKTYGWNKKSDQISLTQFVEGTGIDKKNVIHAISKLVSRHFILKHGVERHTIDGVEIHTKKPATYEINKHVGQWDTVLKSTPSETVVLKATPIMVLESPPTKDKSITKEKNLPPTPSKKPKAEPKYSITFDYDTGEFVMTEAARAKLDRDWEDVDVDVEIRKAEGWVLDIHNKDGRVIQNGLSFLSKWMGKPGAQRKSAGQMKITSGALAGKTLPLGYGGKVQENKRPTAQVDMSKIIKGD
jgi:phage replication O-like protein O